MTRAIPFDRKALQRIHEIARGVPRRINLLCDRAMLGAYAHGRHTIDVPMIEKAAREVFGRSEPTGPVGAMTAGAGPGLGFIVAGSLALGALAAFGLYTGWRYVTAPAPTSAVAAASAGRASASAAASSAVAGRAAASAGTATTTAVNGAGRGRRVLGAVARPLDRGGDIGRRRQWRRPGRERVGGAGAHRRHHTGARRQRLHSPAGDASIRTSTRPGASSCRSGASTPAAPIRAPPRRASRCAARSS